VNSVRARDVLRLDTDRRDARPCRRRAWPAALSSNGPFRGASGVRVHRYYDPQTGQFLTVDPVVDETEDAYGYVAGDPVVNLDLSGLTWENVFQGYPMPSAVPEAGLGALGFMPRNIGVLGHEFLVDSGAIKEPMKVPNSETALPLYRRTANTGSFVDLAVPLQRRVVAKIARRAGVGLSGVKWRIDRDPALVGSGLMGHTSPKGVITLYPDAFNSEDTLTAALIEERIHVYQTTKLGPPVNTAVLNAYETTAKAATTLWMNWLHGVSK
jgi:uncharacterized protein RhaS with RHS repeats